MPKRYGQLFNQVFTLDNLYKAYLVARKGKRKKKAVLLFEKDLGKNLQQLHNELHGDTYQSSGYVTFKVWEPKERLIFAPYFRDTIVQHAIYDKVYPIMDDTFSRESFGCRKGYGTHAAADRAQYFLRQSEEDSYFLQLDIRKFFYRINRDILLQLWARKIKDKKILLLIEQFSQYPDKTGIPIGNLLSQLSSLVYLNSLDQFIKRELKIIKYVRYVDDFILFDLSKEQANKLKDEIEKWLKVNLKLEFSKFTIQKTKRGFNFVGFRTWKKTRFVRKHSMYNFTKAIKKKNIKSIVSILGHAKHSATYKYFIKKVNENGINLQIQTN